ncbi:hypothetical protein BT96DRAFT_1061271, partial [Gymnopus androsaceus JB14]
GQDPTTSVVGGYIDTQWVIEEAEENKFRKRVDFVLGQVTILENRRDQRNWWTFQRILVQPAQESELEQVKEPKQDVVQPVPVSEPQVKGPKKDVPRVAPEQEKRSPQPAPVDRDQSSEEPECFMPDFATWTTDTQFASSPWPVSDLEVPPAYHDIDQNSEEGRRLLHGMLPIQKHQGIGGAARATGPRPADQLESLMRDFAASPPEASFETFDNGLESRALNHPIYGYGRTSRTANAPFGSSPPGSPFENIDNDLNRPI